MIKMTFFICIILFSVEQVLVFVVVPEIIQT